VHHRCLRQIPRLALLSIQKSPLHKLFASQVEQAFITMTGFDPHSFTILLQKFAPAFNKYTPFNKHHIDLKENPTKGG
jgi:hypothetical protein